MKILFTSIYIFFTLALLNPPTANALSCLESELTLFAICENNSCTESFAIENRTYGQICGRNPVVAENHNAKEIFFFVSQKLSMETLNGIYELRMPYRCLERWEDKYSFCHEITLLEKIHDDANFTQLDILKKEWLQIEQQKLNQAKIEKGLGAIAIIVIYMLALLWPWILIKMRSNLRKKFSLILIIAIVIQIPLVLIAFLLSIGWFLPYRLWMSILSTSSLILSLSIIGEIIFLFVRKIKSKKNNTKL